MISKIRIGKINHYSTFNKSLTTNRDTRKRNYLTDPRGILLKIMNIRYYILIVTCGFIFNKYFMKKDLLQDPLYLYKSYKNIYTHKS